jgi:hypothetical protein
MSCRKSTDRRRSSQRNNCNYVNVDFNIDVESDIDSCPEYNDDQNCDGMSRPPCHPSNHIEIHANVRVSSTNKKRSKKPKILSAKVIKKSKM